MNPEILVSLVAAVAGASLGTLLSYIALRSRLQALGERLASLEAEAERLKGALGERGRSLVELGSRLGELEGRVALLAEEVGALRELAVQRSAEPSVGGERGGDAAKLEGGLGKTDEEELLNLKILVLHKRGYSIRQIAREVGLSKTAVHRRLKRLLSQPGRQQRGSR